MQYQITVWNGTEWQEVAIVEGADVVEAIGACAIMFADQPQHFAMRAFAIAVWFMAATQVKFAGSYSMQSEDTKPDWVPIKAIERMGAKRQRYVRFARMMKDMRNGF